MQEEILQARRVQKTARSSARGQDKFEKQSLQRILFATIQSFIDLIDSVSRVSLK